MSKKWIIIWDSGFGEMAEEIEANTHEEAQAAAYEAWKEDAETNAVYGAHEYTEEMAEDYHL